MQFKTNGVTMITDEQKQTAVDLLERSERILITTHVKPDGDACGSVSGLANTFVPCFCPRFRIGTLFF